MNISVHAHTVAADFIDSRAERLDWTRSKYAKQIIDWWLAQGAPPIHDVELNHPMLPPSNAVLDTVDVTRIPIRQRNGSGKPWADTQQQQPQQPQAQRQAVVVALGSAPL